MYKLVRSLFMKKKDIWIETKPAWDEQVLVKEAYDEAKQNTRRFIMKLKDIMKNNKYK